MRYYNINISNLHLFHLQMRDHLLQEIVQHHPQSLRPPFQQVTIVTTAWLEGGQLPLLLPHPLIIKKKPFERSGILYNPFLFEIVGMKLHRQSEEGHHHRLRLHLPIFIITAILLIII